jgi:hypothetical protein
MYMYMYLHISIGFNSKAPKNPADLFKYNRQDENNKNSRFSMMDGLYDSCANDPLKLDGTNAYIYRKIDIRIRLFMYIYVYKNSRFFYDGWLV